MRRREPNASHLAITDEDLVRDVKLLLKTLKEGHDNENEVTGNIGIMGDEIETNDIAKIHVDGDTENNGHNHDDLLRNQVLATEMTAPAMTVPMMTVGVDMSTAMKAMKVTDPAVNPVPRNKATQVTKVERLDGEDHHDAKGGMNDESGVNHGDIEEDGTVKDLRRPAARHDTSSGNSSIIRPKMEE
eukprot:jgi/Phyca11/19530/fgenesh1_pg.PHYCAscaffold_49_\